MGTLDEEDFELYLVAQCLVEPKLSDMDVEALRQKSAKEINRLAMAISGAVDP
jgi:hypothetical protein